MRIHSDVATLDDIYAAARRVPSVSIGRITEHGSRKRERAFEVVLAGTGRNGGAYGNFDGKVATWDEWGVFLGDLYRFDRNMVAGPYPHDHADEYESFTWATGGRYEQGTILLGEAHAKHKWQFTDHYSTYSFVPGTVAAYAEQHCKCGAVRRFVTRRVEVTR